MVSYGRRRKRLKADPRIKFGGWQKTAEANDPDKPSESQISSLVQKSIHTHHPSQLQGESGGPALAPAGEPGKITHGQINKK